MENVLITGVSGGIGRSVAERLLANGSTVVGWDKIVSDEARLLAERYPGKFAMQEVDLMDSEALPGLVKTLVAEFGPLGGFVHCAGFDKMSPLHLVKLSDIENLWRLHALAPMLVVSSLSGKKNHHDGTGVVLISSQSAHEGAMGHTAYAAAKGAVEGFLAPAAAELMERNIRINVVCFAPVKTPMALSWMNNLTNEGKEKLLASYPLGLGEVEDASALICFLLSTDARWINGQIITADGGHAVRKV